DPAGGDTRRRAVTVTATGGGSAVNLSALASFGDVFAGDTNLGGDAAFSRLDAYFGGSLVTPSLTALDGGFIVRDDLRAFDTTHITDLTDGLVDFTGPATYDLGNVVNLTHTTVTVSGGGRTVSLGKASTIDGASFYVAGGATLSLPLATSYTHAATGSD